MKQLPRNPEKFDAFDLFHSVAQQNGFSVTHSDADGQFLKAVAEALARNRKNEALLHGKRVESMFGFIAAALGKTAVVRQEDSGDFYVNEPDL